MLRHLQPLLALALSVTVIAEAPAIAQTDNGQAWVSRQFQAPGGETLCSAMLVDPTNATLNTAVHWVFNDARRDALPTGYLSVHPDAGVADTTIVVDGVRRFALAPGPDGFVYMDPADAAGLWAALRGGLAAEIAGPAGGLPISLIGFTAATNQARAACGP